MEYEIQIDTDIQISLSIITAIFENRYFQFTFSISFVNLEVQFVFSTHETKTRELYPTARLSRRQQGNGRVHQKKSSVS